MRMWMVDPRALCRQHLLGEHGELHKHRHTFVKRRSITGYIRNNCIEPESMRARHDLLAEEMTRRGMNHKSPYEQPDLSYLPEGQRQYKVDAEQSLNDLHERCSACKERFEQLAGN